MRLFETRINSVYLFKIICALFEGRNFNCCALYINLAFTLSVTDITIENSDSVIVAKGQKSGPSKKQAGYKIGPLLHYSFSMSHNCIAYLYR